LRSGAVPIGTRLRGQLDQPLAAIEGRLQEAHASKIDDLRAHASLETTDHAKTPANVTAMNMIMMASALIAVDPTARD
jgi:hypothetical protein